MNKNFNYELEPGRKLNIIKYNYNKVIISVIIPFYNDGKYIEQTINSVLNQTFPAFEILIIDDGSKDKKSLKKLEDVAKLDKRIKVFHKENEGLAATRDYGATKASKETKYFMFLDSDDLIEKTYLETAYWALETNEAASWAYSDSVGFGMEEYTWNKWFDSEKLKTVNDLVATALVRKKHFFEVNGYELREKAVNEDWNFWLKMVSKNFYPVHMSYYGMWYRRKTSGELTKATSNKKRSLKIIKKTAKKIKQKVEAIQYPRYAFNNDLVEYKDSVLLPTLSEKSKKNILMFIPWMVTGGADFFNLEFIKRLDKEKYNVIIISTIPNTNPFRQEMEKYSTIYDLTSFLDRKYWLSFINYLIKKEKIDLFFCTNSMFGYSILNYLKLSYPDIPILDYVHMEEWYYRDGGYARMSSIYKDVIDKTLVCNMHTEKVMVNVFNKEKKDVSTVYIGVDSDKFKPNQEKRIEYLKKYSIPQNKYILSYICRISEQKRPMLLVEIIKKIIKNRDDILFVIAGDGNMMSRFKQAIVKNKLDNYVLILGSIKNAYEIYSISDITINCSIKEGLALTAYESLSMGVPVITADVGGQSELIDETVGYVVPCLQDEKDILNFYYSEEEINNYVVAIDKTIDNLKFLKKNCRNKILDNFTLNQMADNMVLIIEELLKNKSKKCLLTKEKSLECIVDEFNYDIESYYYFIKLYQRDAYGRYYVDNNGNNICNYKWELIREKIWQYKIWRKIVNSKLWKMIKNK